MSLKELSALNLQQIPQDPFYPQFTPTGPAFLDDEACLCAWQQSPDQNIPLAWQCVGNQTKDVYFTKDGMWFPGPPNAPSSSTTLPISDDSTPPDVQQPLMFDNGTSTLIPFNNATNTDMSIFERVCTAKNQTVFSSAFYGAVQEQADNQPMVDAAPCFRQGAVPLEIQPVFDWLQNGCRPGFLCQNNTANSLPQFCPPLTFCQEARVNGRVCTFEGKNIGMGPFEPVVCQQGYYCPAPGMQTIKCPSGHYCQPGAASPTPCAFGSSCPEGSVHSTYVLPIALLILIDVLLIAGIFVLKLKARSKKRALRRMTALQPSTIKNERKGYEALDDEQDMDHEEDHVEDHEMLPLAEPASVEYQAYKPTDVWYGFDAALEQAHQKGMHVTKIEKGLSPQLQNFIDSMRKATDAAHFGLSFSFDNLTFHPKKAPRPVLQKVTGQIDRGALTAVMGGSGAGKSTFVNVLMGKTRNTGGTVMVNDTPDKIERYKKLIGYVPQDDIVLPELTVYENILHSARIRLPRTWTTKDIEGHVNACIDCLELSHVKDSLVGSIGKPVISGGQRKRVSIGMELAAAPMAIFLDEPTSGLDATTASSLMQSLKAIARLGISVIVIIHQPRMEIFEIIDDLILLGNGQMIYQVPEQGVRAYFEEMGFHFSPYANYGDVITDIITGNGRDYKNTGDVSKDGLIAHWEKVSVTRKRPQIFSTVYDNTGSVPESTSLQQALKPRGTRLYRQLILCLNRAMLQQYRLLSTFWFEMGLSALAGFLLGLAQQSKNGVFFIGLYYPPFDVLSISTDFKSVPEMSLLTCVAIGLVAGAPGVKVFSEETLLQRREAEAGHSQLAYFVAKQISAIPRMSIACIHFTSLFLLLATPIIGAGLTFLVNFLYFAAIYGLASIVSMFTRREDAPLFATMIGLIVGILSGAAPPLSSVASWHMEWLWRAGPGVYLAEVYFGKMVNPFTYLYQVDLASKATGFHLDWVWRNIAILFGLGGVYRVLAFGGLYVGKNIRLG